MVNAQDTRGYAELKAAVRSAQGVDFIEKPKTSTRRWNVAEKVFNRIKPMLVEKRLITDHYSFTGFCDEFMCDA